jgi:hypothetical protein
MPKKTVEKPSKSAGSRARQACRARSSEGRVATDS